MDCIPFLRVFFFFLELCRHRINQPIVYIQSRASSISIIENYITYYYR